MRIKEGNLGPVRNSGDFSARTKSHIGYLVWAKKITGISDWAEILVSRIFSLLVDLFHACCYDIFILFIGPSSVRDILVLN